MAVTHLTRVILLAPQIIIPTFEFGWYIYFPQSDTYGRSPESPIL